MWYSWRMVFLLSVSVVPSWNNNNNFNNNGIVVVQAQPIVNGRTAQELLSQGNALGCNIRKEEDNGGRFRFKNVTAEYMTKVANDTITVVDCTPNEVRGDCNSLMIHGCDYVYCGGGGGVRIDDDDENDDENDGGNNTKEEGGGSYCQNAHIYYTQEALYCNHTEACTNTFIRDTYGDVLCEGMEACGGSKIYSSRYDVICNGTNSCENSDIEFTYGHVKCIGNDACSNVNQITNFPVGEHSIECSNEEACPMEGSNQYSDTYTLTYTNPSLNSTATSGAATNESLVEESSVEE